MIDRSGKPPVNIALLGVLVLALSLAHSVVLSASPSTPQSPGEVVMLANLLGGKTPRDGCAEQRPIGTDNERISGTDSPYQELHIAYTKRSISTDGS